MMAPAWAWAIAGPLFAIGFAAFLSALVPKRDRGRAEPFEQCHHVKLQEPKPYDWKRDQR
jgi:hypothetical protein